MSDLGKNMLDANKGRIVIEQIGSALLREVLTYHPDTGLFNWNADRKFGNKINAHAGAVAGHNRGGYVWIRINGTTYLAHRLAYLYMCGQMPDGLEVDHEDGNTLNNAWANMSWHKPGSRNQKDRRPRRNNKSGVLGVSWSKASKAWRAQITINGKGRCIGNYADIRDAEAAYLKAKREAHECNKVDLG